jgi:hypothetical protein
MRNPPLPLLENAVASSAERREVDCIKKGRTRVSEAALEPQLLKVI